MPDIDARVAAVCRFGRFYARRVQVLHEAPVDPGWPLPESRVLHELATRADATAPVLARELGLDALHLGRILRRFEQDGWLARETPERDGADPPLRLSGQGLDAFAAMATRQDARVARLLAALPEAAAHDLVAAMQRIETLLGGVPVRTWSLRGLRPGDLGWVVSRHGVLFASEQGWGRDFEVLVSHAVAEAMAQFDPARENVWIAERDGVPVGSVFLLRGDDSTAKLRLLLVEPSARELGIGSGLVDACTAFARQAGYRCITVWTHPPLAAARRLYLRAGYRLIVAEPGSRFGQDLVNETWQLDL